jgi:hypothetical protein
VQQPHISIARAIDEKWHGARLHAISAQSTGESPMAEAYIIDAVRTPRSIGKVGKGALSHMHPQHLAAAVLKALKERNNLNTAEVDDII